jgi:hypothetical protein
MPSIVLSNGPNYLTYATLQNPRDPFLAAYANACASDNIPYALSLASTLDPGAVTSGLNTAVQKGYLELARQLLTAGAKWDAFTIKYASSSFDAVKLLVECGYDVNTRLIGGGALLPYVPFLHSFAYSSLSSPEKKIWENKNSCQCVSMVVGHNDEVCIRYLLALGANPSFGPSIMPQDTSPRTVQYRIPALFSIKRLVYARTTLSACYLRMARVCRMKALCHCITQLGTPLH